MSKRRRSNIKNRKKHDKIALLEKKSLNEITITFGERRIGTAQSISYTVSREPIPIYTMNTADPRSQFARGRRNIAGTLTNVEITDPAWQPMLDVDNLDAVFPPVNVTIPRPDHQSVRLSGVETMSFTDNNIGFIAQGMIVPQPPHPTGV